MQQMLEAGLGLIFPDRCAGCGKVGTIWCTACDESMARITDPVCPVCGEPVKSEGLCHRCSTSPLPFAVRSYALYQGPLVKLILQVKYRNDHRLMSLLGGWLAELVRRNAWSASLVTAVPLGRRRQRERGYNQAGAIAEALAAEIDTLYCPEALVRVRETPSQVGLDAAARMENVRGAFQADARHVSDRPCLIVDDLFTTGATLHACANALRSAGAADVRAVTVARARGRT